MLGFKSIIVEGADQQGKSELCKQLANLTGFKIVHYGMPPQGFDFHEDYILEDGIIYDRNFLSEVVYARIRRQPCRVKRLEALQHRMIANMTLLILCDRGSYFNFDDSRHEEYKEVQIEMAMNLYRRNYANLIMSKMKFNPNTDKLCI